MKGVVFCVLSLILVACGYHDDATEQFITSDRTGDKAGSSAVLKSEYFSHTYAQYRFAIKGSYDVYLLLKLNANDRGFVRSMEVKDVTPGREHIPVEEVTFDIDNYNSVSRNENEHTTYSIESDMSSLVVDGNDIGGVYTGSVTVPVCNVLYRRPDDWRRYRSQPTHRIPPEYTDQPLAGYTKVCRDNIYLDITTSEQDWNCCGIMSFKPAVGGKTVYGQRVNTDHTLDDAWWNKITGQCKLKPVFTEMPQEIMAEKEAHFNVELRDCEDKLYLEGKDTTQVHISEKYIEHHPYWYGRKNFKLKYGVAKVSLLFPEKLAKALKEEEHYQDKVRYKATIIVNDNTYTAVSDWVDVKMEEEETE